MCTPKALGRINPNTTITEPID